MSKIYYIHQIRLSDVDDTDEKLESFRAIFCYGSKSFKPEDFELYTLVAKAKADSMGQLFKLMNLWPEDFDITRFDDLHSLSVGDIIQDKDTYYMVEPEGFKEVFPRLASEIELAYNSGAVDTYYRRPRIPNIVSGSRIITQYDMNINQIKAYFEGYDNADAGHKEY